MSPVPLGMGFVFAKESVKDAEGNPALELGINLL